MLKLHFKTQEELVDLLVEGYEELSMEIVHTILKNIDAKKGEFKVAEITFNSSDDIADIYVEPEDFILTLSQNIWVFEEIEDYETCAKIRDAIKYLEEK